MTKVVPTKEMRKIQAAVCISKAQAYRMAQGQMESRASDYARLITEENTRLREARHRVEDLRIARELGIDP